MKNIWTYHLEKSNANDNDGDSTFSQMLHSFVRTGNDEKMHTGISMGISQKNKNTGNIDVNKAETQLCTWMAESHEAYELGIDSSKRDSVRLIMAEDGGLSLRYDVAGETPFEMSVRSEEEAMDIIEEDNATTEQLYPDNPELKWIKIT
ncbi:hypothetical protein [Methanolobus bombayensis]|uniref:hypothetical protein n=1 Tax=Methanolobus bombayensis TaxID=38023 RepID=UPI001AE1EB7B|nr:hypothetical protein [Methanolobus bombayensis]MBP1908894.1 uncharacterized protein YneR [Methanolobus bombayensis]